MKKFIKFGAVLTAMVLSCFVSCGGGDSGGDGSGETAVLQGLWKAEGEENELFYFKGNKAYHAAKVGGTYYYVDVEPVDQYNPSKKNVKNTAYNVSVSGDQFAITKGSQGTPKISKFSINGNTMTISELEGNVKATLTKVNANPTAISSLGEDAFVSAFLGDASALQGLWEGTNAKDSMYFKGNKAYEVGKVDSTYYYIDVSPKDETNPSKNNVEDAYYVLSVKETNSDKYIGLYEPGRETPKNLKFSISGNTLTVSDPNSNSSVQLTKVNTQPTALSSLNENAFKTVYNSLKGSN